MLDQRIQGLYGITPNNNLNIALIERIFNEHKVNILQYRHKTNNDKLKLEEAKRLLELCLQHVTRPFCRINSSLPFLEAGKNSSELEL